MQALKTLAETSKDTVKLLGKLTELTKDGLQIARDTGKAAGLLNAGGAPVTTVGGSSASGTAISAAVGSAIASRAGFGQSELDRIMGMNPGRNATAGNLIRAFQEDQDTRSGATAADRIHGVNTIDKVRKQNRAFEDAQNALASGIQAFKQNDKDFQRSPKWERDAALDKLESSLEKERDSLLNGWDKKRGKSFQDKLDNIALKDGQKLVKNGLGEDMIVQSGANGGGGTSGGGGGMSALSKAGLVVAAAAGVGKIAMWGIAPGEGRVMGNVDGHNAMIRDGVSGYGELNTYLRYWLTDPQSARRTLDNTIIAGLRSNVVNRAIVGTIDWMTAGVFRGGT